MRRFETWAGCGLPQGWAASMGLKDYKGDTVWPIVDRETCGEIDGWPRPEQMLCWCPTAEKQAEVARLLNKAVRLCPHDAARTFLESADSDY